MDTLSALKAITAASICAAKKDVRDYLNGICIDQHQEGAFRIVGCDGHKLIVIECEGRFFYGHNMPDQTGQLIISKNDIAMVVGKLKLLKKQHRECYFECEGFIVSGPDLGDITKNTQYPIEPIDGTYPDYMRVMPSACDPLQNDGTGFASLNPDYIIEASRALKPLCAGKYPRLAIGIKDANSAVEFALPPVSLIAGVTSARAVVMPLKPDANGSDRMPTRNANGIKLKAA